MTVNMYDTIGTTAANIPENAEKIAGYVTGSGDVPWSAAEFARFTHAGKVKIEQDPAANAPVGEANVLDVETGAATPETAVTWVRARMDHGIQWSDIYGSGGVLLNVAAKLAAAGIHGPARVRFWLADWNLNRQEAAALVGTLYANTGISIVAVQWASPTSNPNTLTPGSTLTLSQSNIDLSETAADWFPAPAPPPPPPPPPPALQHGYLVTVSPLVTDALSGRAVTSEDGGKTWR